MTLNIKKLHFIIGKLFNKIFYFFFFLYYKYENCVKN